MEAQNKQTIKYPMFEGQLDEHRLDAFRKQLRKAIVKTHAKVILQ